MTTPYGLYNMVETLCAVATKYEEGIVTQWGDAAIIIEPDDDPFNVYADVRAFLEANSHG